MTDAAISKPMRGVVYAWEGEVDGLRAEVARLRHICKTISTGLRGDYASREDMWKLADSAEVE